MALRRGRRSAPLPSRTTHGLSCWCDVVVCVPSDGPANNRGDARRRSTADVAQGLLPEQGRSRPTGYPWASCSAPRSTSRSREATAAGPRIPTRRLIRARRPRFKRARSLRSSGKGACDGPTSTSSCMSARCFAGWTDQPPGPAQRDCRFALTAEMLGALEEDADSPTGRRS